MTTLTTLSIFEIVFNADDVAACERLIRFYIFYVQKDQQI